VRSPASLRSRFLLIVLAGAILPLAATGYWLTRSAVRSAEQLLHTQLDTSLATTVALVERRWELRNADLVYLADNDVSVHLLAGARAAMSRDDSAFLVNAYRAFARDFPLVRLRDRAGAVRWQVDESTVVEPDRALQRAAVPSPEHNRVAVNVPAEDPAGHTIGRLEAEIRFEALLPNDALPALVNAAQFSVRDTGTGTLFRGTGLGESATTGRFDVAGATWLSVHRTVAGLPLLFTLSAPAGPFLQSFEQGAQIGLALLVVITAVAVLLAAFFTTRLTRSIESLADAADAIAAGDLAHEVSLHPQPTGEVRRLAGSFQTMVASLQKTLHDLARRESLAAVGEFAATMSHEVRNGLSSVRLDLQQVQESMPPDDRTGALLSRALRNVERLNSTVTGALGVARGDKDKWQVLELVPVLEAAADAADGTFTKSGGVLKRNLSAANGCRTPGDASALEQLFVNLLINAGQALAPGAEATLDVRLAGEEGVVVSIRDTGAGMAPPQVARAGEPFYSSKAGGTGLGLSIAKKIAAAHGGELTVESTPGEGTVVRVKLRTVPFSS
jgi:signal transduction histidine kinase